MKTNTNRDEEVRVAVQVCVGDQSMQMSGRGPRSIPGSRNRPDEPRDVLHLLCNLKLT